MAQKHTQLENYIIKGIDNSGYSDNKLTTEREKVSFLADTFTSEYAWAIKRYGVTRALAEWLAGLPSSVYVEWRNHEIIELAVALGYLNHNATGWQQDAFLQTWFAKCADAIEHLFKQHNITILVGE